MFTPSDGPSIRPFIDVVKTGEEYWLNDNTGVIYNFDLDYPIGKIKKDDDGNLIKLDNNVYVIESLINIPIEKIFI